jgi:hypothetical protein
VRSLIAATQTTVAVAGKSRFHSGNGMSAVTRKLCGEVPQIVIEITELVPELMHNFLFN